MTLERAAYHVQAFDDSVDVKGFAMLVAAAVWYLGGMDHTGDLCAIR